MTVVPILLALLGSALAAAGLRLRSLVATLLAAYLVLVAQVAAVTWLLSPFDAVTATGLDVAELVFALAAGVFWWARGRPRPSLEGARADLAAARDPLTLAFLGLLAVALAYELVLAVTVPPNNWDSLTYHLARVAAWRQEHGIHWIANAPTGRMNEFQPLAEQQVLFAIVAGGTTMLYALPQYIAELAILAAAYGSARRLGFEPHLAARGTALLATLSLVALESTTAQNDLVAASFPATAAFLLLGGGGAEAALAGVAVALGLGAKLTTGLALPVLAWLAWRAGRRVTAHAAAGVAAGLLVAGAWGYVLNLARTGHLLGHGQGRVENTASFSIGGTVRRFGHLVYRLFDLTVMPHWLIFLLAAAGVALAAAVYARTRSLLLAAGALPLLTPLVALAVIDVITGQDPGNIPRAANEDFSAFGPIGTFALIAAPLAVLGGRRDGRRVALALALPVFMLLLAATAKYNVWITRFLVVPVALTAPLFGALVRTRVAALSLLALGGITAVLVLTDDAAKKVNGSVGPPWTLSQVDAMNEFPAQPTGHIVADALAAYDRAVPERACVGAVLDPDEPAYLLWGPDLRRRVFFLPSLAALETAERRNVAYVVVSTGVNAPVAGEFADAGWSIRKLGSYWQLAVAPAGQTSSVLTAC